MKTTRREALKKALYFTPVILTLPATLTFASCGSGKAKGKSIEKGPRSNNRFGLHKKHLDLERQ